MCYFNIEYFRFIKINLTASSKKNFRFALVFKCKTKALNHLDYKNIFFNSIYRKITSHAIKKVKNRASIFFINNFFKHYSYFTIYK